MTKTMSIRDLTRNGSMLTEYDYIDIEDIKGGDSDYNANAFLTMLDNPNNSFQKIVELNAGATIYIAGIMNSLKDSFLKAHQLIKTGKTKEYFKNFIRSFKFYQSLKNFEKKYIRRGKTTSKNK